ncbi:hypothetical protein, partial [Ferrimicrobium sp.]|uniref:hypothetical protein n=1 Tax=Ferrimicrobium sp. TaxID=2926050 RepID=UPI00261B000F
ALKKSIHPLAAPERIEPQGETRSETSQVRTSMFGARIPVRLHKDIRRWTFDNEISMAQLLGRLLRIFLDRNDPLGEEMRKRILGQREP